MSYYLYTTQFGDLDTVKKYNRYLLNIIYKLILLYIDST